MSTDRKFGIALLVLAISYIISAFLPPHNDAGDALFVVIGGILMAVSIAILKGAHEK